MHDLLSGLFSYPFIQRALIAGTLVALCSALLGVSLVLKRYSMIGDGLSHVGFGAMAVAMALGAAPLAVALPVVILAAFFLLRLSRGSRLAGDSAIALVSSGALAIGVVATSLSSGSNVDVMNYLFGSILTMTAADVKLAVLLSLAVLLLFLLIMQLHILFQHNLQVLLQTCLHFLQVEQSSLYQMPLLRILVHILHQTYVVKLSKFFYS